VVYAVQGYLAYYSDIALECSSFFSKANLAESQSRREPISPRTNLALGATGEKPKVSISCEVNECEVNNLEVKVIIHILEFDARSVVFCEPGNREANCFDSGCELINVSYPALLNDNRSFQRLISSSRVFNTVSASLIDTNLNETRSPGRSWPMRSISAEITCAILG
jgi:hypothetical protein